MSKSQVDALQRENNNLQETMSELETQITSLSSRLFNIDRFKQDEDISFYTGFPNIQTLTSILDFLDPGINCENIRPRQNSNEMPEDFYESHDEDESLAPKRGRQHKLKSADEFFFCYVSSKERIFRVTSGSFIWCCSIYHQQNLYFMDQLYVS